MFFFSSFFRVPFFFFFSSGLLGVWEAEQDWLSGYFCFGGFCFLDFVEDDVNDKPQS